ncbi:MAG TPA: BON domain-containing protein [Steroidobacteraceae bacterium]|nr:BON domain-containing protein [Steroidobacteraceae bacterium]
MAEAFTHQGEVMAQRYDDPPRRSDWRERDREWQRDPRRDDYSWRGEEYGGGPRDPGSSYDIDYERPWREQPFGEPEESPRYFGSGSYGEGGTHFTGGYEQRGLPRDTDSEFARRAGEAPYGGRAFKRGPKGYQRSDERLREDISERIMEAAHVDSSDVSVNVVGGKVILEGTVPDRYTKHYIEDLADAAPGVQDIENRIRVRR